LNVFSKCELRVTMIPTSTTRNSKSRRKLF